MQIPAFRTKHDRPFSVSSTSGCLQSHFKGRIFGKYGKFWGIWRVTKLYAYKGRIALFDFQYTLWLLCILSKKTNTHLFMSSFWPSQVAPDIGHNHLISTSAEVPVIVYQACLSKSMKKPTTWHVRTAKTQISLGMHPVWSESSLSAWRMRGSLATY